MRHLFEILKRCFDILEVRFLIIIFVFATAVDLADKIPPSGTLTTQLPPDLRY